MAPPFTTDDGGSLCGPLVSVILPTYNRREIVPKSIRSVLDQTYGPRELIVVDDGSTDGTGEMIRSEFPEVRYVWQPRAGVAAARNLGLAEARGELIAFQDSDDLWHREKLAQQVALLASRPEVGVVCTAERLIDTEDRVIGCQWKKLHSGWVTEALFRSVFVIMPSTVVRRSVVERVGRFDTTLRISSDYQFWLRASLLTQFAAIDRPLVDERLGSNRLTQAKATGAVLQYWMMWNFYHDLGGHIAIRPRVARHALAKQAFRAGRALRREGRLADAPDMFARSVAHRLRPRAVWGWAASACRAAWSRTAESRGQVFAAHVRDVSAFSAQTPVSNNNPGA